MTSATITWLHLSDLHACSPYFGWDADRVLDALVKDLDCLRQEYALTPDLVFFTGDLAFGNYGQEEQQTLQGQYPVAGEFLAGVRSAYSPAIPAERLYVVPGNHDVNRQSVLASQTQWLDGHTDRFTLSQLLSDAGPEWQNVIARLEEYRKWLTSEEFGANLTDDRRILVSGCVDSLPLPVGIGGLNSSWSSCRDGEQGKLRLGYMHQLNAVDADTKRGAVRILLMHHPPDWAIAEESRYFKTRFLQEYSFLLHGHEHYASVDPRDDGFCVIGAGPCYERSDGRNGYNIVRLNVDERTADVWLREYDDAGGGWTAKVVHGRTDDSGIWHLSRIKTFDDGSGPGARGVSPPPSEDELVRQLRVMVDGGGLVVGSTVVSPQEVRIAVRTRPQGLPGLATPVAPTEGARPDAPSQHDARIDRAMEYLKGATPSPDAARSLLQEMQADDVWTGLSQHEKFRVLANIGNTYHFQGDYERAAECWEAAAEQEIDAETARLHSVLALEMRGLTADANAAAQQLRREFPGSTRATAIWVSTTEDSVGYEELRDAVPVQQRKNVEVALALANAALARGLHAEAEEHARDACAAGPDAVQASLTLAVVLLQRAGALIRDPVHAQARLVDDSPVREAIERLCTVIDRLEGRGDACVVGHALVERAVAHAYLGELNETDSDLVRAGPLVMKCPYEEVTIKFAGLMTARGNGKQAIRAMERFAEPDEISPQIAVLLSFALDERNEGNDQEKAIALIEGALDRWVGEPIDIRLDVVGALVMVLQNAGRADRANAVLDSLGAAYMGDVGEAALRALLLHESGDKEGANRTALLGLERTRPTTSSAERTRLAHVLTLLGMHENALPLWRDVIRPADVGPRLYGMLTCAANVGDHKTILEMCSAVRESGVHDVLCFDHEMAMLEGYNPARAIQLMQERLRREPKDRNIHLRLSLLGLRKARKDLVETDPGRLPAVDELPPDVCSRVPFVLHAAGKLHEALVYSYRLLLRHPESIEASRAYLGLLSPGGGEPVPVPRPEAVCSGAAVKVRFERETEDRWYVVIEASDDAVLAGSLAANHPLAMAMLGKRKGDTFEHPAKGIEPRKGEVLEVVSKYVFLYRDLIENWEDRFPDDGGMQRYRVGAAEDGGAGPDFSLIIKALTQQQEQVAGLEKEYARSMMPVATFAELAGRGVLAAVAHIAGQPEMRLRCCTGNADESRTASENLANAEVLVLDPTAICTLVLLGLHEVPDWAPMRCIVTPSCLDYFRASYVRAQLAPPPAGLLGVHEGKLTFTREQEEARQQRITSLSNLLSWLESMCDPSAGEVLLDLPAAERRLREDVIGRATLESIVASKRAKHVLWTDDLVVALLACQDFGVARVWTQFLLRHWSGQDSIPQDMHLEASAKLAGWGYHFTSLNPGIIQKAATLAEWNPDRWPFQQVLDCLALEEVSIDQNASLALSIIRAVYRELSLEASRQRIVLKVLDALGRHKGGYSAARSIRSLLDRAFGVDVVGAREAGGILDAWLAGTRRIVVP